jgi:hypothetical protein
VNILIFKGAGKKSAYRAGSLIPLEELDGQGIIQISSRGRIIVPPVRYWLGKLLAVFITVTVTVSMRSYLRQKYLQLTCQHQQSETTPTLLNHDLQVFCLFLLKVT